MQAAKSKPRPGIWRYSAAIFLGTLILWYVAEPFIEEVPFGEFLRPAIFSLVLIAAAMAIGEKRYLLVWAAIVSTSAIGMLWFRLFRPDVLRQEYLLWTVLLFALFISFRLLRFILMAPVVDSEVLCAAVATYLMAALSWAFMYILVGLVNPQAFVWTIPPPHHKMEGFTAIYFSLTTQATLGYGDIVPRSYTARLLAVTQAVGGMFYMTLLVARLVGVYSAEGKTANPR
jgi:hypothetical protein